MKKIELRDYQVRQVDIGVDYFSKTTKQKPSLLVAPTGAGKSLIIGSIVNKIKEPTLVLQPSKELLEQNYSKLIGFGGEATIYSASAGKKEMSHCTYATLGSIKSLSEEFKAIGVKNVIIDEPHSGYSPDKSSVFMQFMNALNPKKVLGLTATPLRLENYGDINDSYTQLNLLHRLKKSSYFKDILDIQQISDMVERGFWSKLYYECHEFDESKLLLNSTGAEFSEHSITRAIKEQNINNKIYHRLKKLLDEGKKSILVFCDTVDNAEKMASLFGDIAACVSSNTDLKERAKILERFKNGELKIVTNMGVLTTGFDHPEIDTIILGKPTNSLSLYYQIFGRGVRIHELKEYCLLIDFGNNVKRFGRLEDLNFEFIEGYGWGLFSGERLLTNTRITDALPRTKEDLRNKAKKDAKDAVNMEIWFGAHKGKRISELPTEYMKWCLTSWDFSNKKMKMMKSQMESVLVSRKELVILTK